MKKLTQLQYEVIFLYSKGLTFNEIDKLLRTSSKGLYSQVVIKDKSRITRAKISRQKNITKYKLDLTLYLLEVKAHNKNFKKSPLWIQEKYVIPKEVAKVRFRNRYLLDNLNKSFKSYSKYKITFIRNLNKKLA